jgi:MFS family permease
MLIGGIILGLVLGLVAGGSIGQLANVRLRWVGLLLLAVILRFATELFLIRGVALVEALRLPLFLLAFLMLLAALWVNRMQPGLRMAFVGILLNTIAIAANAGHMPIWLPSLIAAGFTPADVTSPFHTILPPSLSADFFAHAGPLADILPIPLPIIRNVASLGDLFLTAGLAFFLFATVLRGHPEDAETTDAEGEGGNGSRIPLGGLAGATRLPRSLEAAVGGHRLRPGTGLAETVALDRPLVLGSPVGGVANRAIALAPVPATPALDGVAAPRPRIEVGVLVRRHPYVRLALNGSFSSLWTGQLISLFGDRVHQVALAFLVAGVTNSPVAVAFVFVAATLPNLLLSPIAGTYVDRWDQRDVMIVSDLLRASFVLLIPIAAVTNIYLVYPFVFLITTVSVFFRPARIAVLPRIVRQDELLTANAAMWGGETFADVIGYPLAGIFVAFLGSALPLAFWLDAATYVGSAMLISSIFVPPKRKRVAYGEAETAEEPRKGVIAEMREGFAFLRNERVLFSNTIQATVAQFALGAMTALTPLYVRDVVASPVIDPKAAYAFMETSLGVGNLVGGFVIGLIGMGLARGRTVILGYTLWGMTVVALGLIGNFGLALGIVFGTGVFNMVFVIPSQTLFQERTPPELMGRVLGFRFALVFGSMTIAMAVGGLLATVVGVAAVFVLTGTVTILAGLAGLLVPDMRDA